MALLPQVTWIQYLEFIFFKIWIQNFIESSALVAELQGAYHGHHAVLATT